MPTYTIGNAWNNYVSKQLKRDLQNSNEFILENSPFTNERDEWTF